MGEPVIRPWCDLEAQQRSFTAYLELLIQIARNAPSVAALSGLPEPGPEACSGINASSLSRPRGLVRRTCCRPRLSGLH